MTLKNVFQFNYSNTVEQSLLDDLNRESIQIHGLDFEYIPRVVNNEDYLFTEDTISSYSNTYTLEMAVIDVDGFQGEGNFLSKFGLQINDQITLAVNKNRFGNTVTEQSRPEEGDLIYFPLNSKIFEVTFVDHENPFYQLGGEYQYVLTCELYTSSSDRFQTGNTTFDAYQDDIAYSQDLTMVSGSGAYELDEYVYQGSNLSSANVSGTVSGWTSNVLSVVDITGIWANGTLIVGDTSNAQFYYVANTTVEDDELFIPNQLSDNLDLENEADGLIDTSEDYPWSNENI